MTTEPMCDAPALAKPSIVIHVAMARNGVIGRDGDMPWRLSTDLKRFKAATMGKPIIMGRRTWESFPRQPLPGRHNIVITRNPNYCAEGADRAASLDEAIVLAGPVQEICIIGGGQVYSQAMGLAERLEVTHILADIEGDTRFPEIDPKVWTLLSENMFPAGEKDSHSTRHAVYLRSKV